MKLVFHELFCLAKTFIHSIILLFIMKDKKVKFIEFKVFDISDTFAKLKRKVSGQKFKDMARREW